MKRFVPWSCALAGLFLAGCVNQQPKPAAPAVAIITPSNSLYGKVVSYNPAGRFVVLNFPSRQLPKIERRIFLYRNGLKVAEVKVTGPQNDDNTVADLVSGDAQAGDEARDE